jgi:hypothetical protein
MMRWNHSQRARRRGYVLLLVLFVVALAAAAMAGICRMCLEKAVHASRAEAELHRRWAVITCRSVLINKAEAMLSKERDSISEVRRDIRLGGSAYTLIFGDEQAKANVNLLYAQSGLAGAEREVRSIVQASGAAMPVELRPIPGRGKTFGSPDADENEPLAFEGFGQVFGRTPPQILVAGRGAAPSAVAGVTCWGDGSLNLRRASDEAVRAVLARHLPAGEISRLLAFRAKNPKLEDSELLDALALPAARREAVEDLLTSESACHSLWIISDSGDRNGYDLAITEGEAAVIMFNW